MNRREKPVNEKDIHVGCFNCSSARSKADLDMFVAIGFGSAFVTCDGNEVYSEPRDMEQAKTLRHFEAMAKEDPDHDWRCHIHGPLYDAVWQRHGDDEWIMIETGKGFA